MPNFQSITFGSNGQIVDTSLEAHIRPMALGDTARSRVGIATNTSDFASFNTGAGAATQGTSTLRVQLNQPTNLVKALGTEMAPEVLENLQKMQPELFVEPAAKQAEVKAEAEADTAAAEEATSAARHLRTPSSSTSPGTCTSRWMRLR